MSNESNDTSDRVDYVFETIKRYDLFLNSTNTKASLILAWNGFVLSLLLLRYDGVLSNYRQARWSVTVAVLLLTCVGVSALISSVQAFRGVFPYLKADTSAPNERKGSMVFFGSVATMSAEEFYSRISTSTADDRLRDIADQAVILARGTKAKMLLVRSSIMAAGCELVFLFALLVLKIFIG